MSKKDMKTNISISVKIRTLDKLNAMAYNHKCSKSKIVNLLLDRYLDDIESLLDGKETELAEWDMPAGLSDEIGVMAKSMGLSVQEFVNESCKNMAESDLSIPLPLFNYEYKMVTGYLKKSNESLSSFWSIQMDMLDAMSNNQSINESLNKLTNLSKSIDDMTNEFVKGWENRYGTIRWLK